jgi:hypothetical protein
LGCVGVLTNRPSPDGEDLSSLGAVETLGLEGPSEDQLADRTFAPRSGDFPASRSESTVRAGVSQAGAGRMAPSGIEDCVIVISLSARRVFKLTCTFDGAQLMAPA